LEPAVAEDLLDGGVAVLGREVGVDLSRRAAVGGSSAGPARLNNLRTRARDCVP
jgi:hypothetical protein